MKRVIKVKRKKSWFSLEHKKFIRKERTKSFFTVFSRVTLLILILALWELSARLNWADPFITSSPSRVITKIYDLYASGSLFSHIWTTLSETLLAFALSTAIGMVIAVILYLISPIRRVLEPYLVVLNSLPKIALGPLIIVWVGVGTSAIVTMGIMICVVITTINLLNAYIDVSSEKIMLLRSMGANKFQIMTRLVFPATTSNLISTLKINLGMAWVGVIMGEYLSSRAGLGYLLVYGGQVFDLDLVMSSIVILCLLSALMYAFIAIIEKIVIREK